MAETVEAGRLLPSRRPFDYTSYILGEVIARGQYSTVYKCLYKGKIDRVCRIYNKENIKTQKLSSLETIMRINHPNIIHIYDVAENEKELCVFCERITGRELFEDIVQCGHYSETVAAKAIKSILSALECLHREGIVHGDVRPESLLYQTPSPNSPLKLRDVSLSKLSPSTFTAFYLAPEKGRCKGDGIEEDIWSLGIVLYIMLCGLEPSESGRRLSLCGFSLPWWDDISGSAKELIQQLLEESPENRISASKALQHPWVNGDTSNVHHMPTTVERLKEFNARHKFRAATKAVLATHRLGISPQMKKNAR